MKNLFEINNEEKMRILNLHESATKKHYLTEDVESETSFNLLPPSKEDINYGWDIVTKLKGKKNLKFWAEQKKFPKDVIKAFGVVDVSNANETNADEKSVGVIGRYFRKNPNKF